MRVCHCPLSCFSNCSLHHYSPCPLKLEDVRHVSSRPSPGSIVLEKKLSDEKVEFEKNRLVDGKVEIFLKSSLKKQTGSSSKEVRKGRVKWMDFLGRELVEIREFEPFESREPEETVDSNPACMCIIL